MITIVTILLWIGSIRGCTPTLKELGYSLEKYGQSPGIYYEYMGQVNLYNTEWQVLLYDDLLGIRSQSNEIALYIKYINKLCEEIQTNKQTNSVALSPRANYTD
jgi:hypothetical protein